MLNLATCRLQDCGTLVQNGCDLPEADCTIRSWNDRQCHELMPFLCSSPGRFRKGSSTERIRVLLPGCASSSLGCYCIGSKVEHVHVVATLCMCRSLPAGPRVLELRRCGLYRRRHWPGIKRQRRSCTMWLEQHVHELQAQRVWACTASDNVPLHKNWCGMVILLWTGFLYISQVSSGANKFPVQPAPSTSGQPSVVFPP